MVGIFRICDSIAKEMNLLIQDKLIIDYRIVLRTNENLYLYVLRQNESSDDEINRKVKRIYSNVEIEYLVEDLLKDEHYYQMFSTTQEINVDKGRRRFDSLLNPNNCNFDNNCPIITFYSYKGGMGRTTTLAAFATHLALNENLNVFIIDCDLEAPGFSNFFLKNPSENNQRQGFVEYLLDKQCNLASNKILEEYTWEVDHKFSGQGNIRIMPAGNLDTECSTDDFLKTHLSHYVEGLSRIDIENQDYIMHIFNGIIEDIKKSFSPDVILIDSRTGLNDVMGISVCLLSKFIVGFFRNDVQSIPGLSFFLKKMIERDDIEPFLINSILPSSRTSKNEIFETFQSDVQSIIDSINPETTLSFPCFPISRNEDLEVIGTAFEKIDDFVDLIRNKDIKDFRIFFESISKRISDFTSKRNLNVITNDVDETTSDLPSEETKEKAPTLDDINRASDEQKTKWISNIKEKILSTTYSKIQELNLYAENLSIEDEFENKRFFFRSCMNDLFNTDKPIILGSKGTGKSYIYNALKSKKIVSFLKQKANKKDDFYFLYTIDRKDRIFKVSKFNKNINDSLKYRFWLIYTWQILSKDILQIFPNFVINDNIEIFDIKDDETTLSHFKKLMNDDNYSVKIEREFQRVNDYLLHIEDSKKKYITIIYDQLDEIVDPTYWDEWLPSLIDFWRFKRFSRIFGKLFIRKDLFRKLSGLSNVKDIENQAIDIEWTREEVFSFFFKIIFSDDIADYFWSLMNLYNDFAPNIIAKCRKVYNNKEQIILEEYMLKPLVVTFFGLYVDVNRTTRMGESYEWFYKNLKNADDTISLRPFIDMMELAIEEWKTKKYKSEEFNKPILFQKYYTDRDVRLKAVDRHYEDLVRNEKGNKPIEYIFDHLSNSSPKYKKITLGKVLFESLLTDVIKQYGKESEMKNQTIQSLELLLITNGIVKKENFGRGDGYKFSFLYKYKLGLRGV